MFRGDLLQEGLRDKHVWKSLDLCLSCKTLPTLEDHLKMAEEKSKGGDQKKK
jgi:hypothetical protein